MSLSFLRWWGPLLLYMGLVFWLSSRPLPEGLVKTPDFLLHGGAYFAMALLSVRALARGLLDPASRAVLWGGVAIAIAYGASDEWHQSFVPEREASASDFLADAAGALGAGALLAVFWAKRRGGTAGGGKLRTGG